MSFKKLAAWAKGNSRCRKCPLAKTRTKVVSYRRGGPDRDVIDLLLIGEAPGPDEDKRGEPFIGRSGKLLQKMLDTAEGSKPFFTYAIINTLGCFPKDQAGHPRPPTEKETNICSPRTIAAVNAADPRTIILVGSVARNWFFFYRGLLNLRSDCLVDSIHHPAYLLRQGGDKSPAYTENYVKLSRMPWKLGLKKEYRGPSPIPIKE